MDYVEACNSPDRQTRIEAIKVALNEEKLDNNLFKDIIDNCSYDDVLVEIAKNDKNYKVASKAFDKISDNQDIFIDLVKNAHYADISYKAIDKIDIDNQEIWIDFAKNTKNHYILMKSVDMIAQENRGFLVDVAKNVDNSSLKIDILAKITDENFEWAQNELVNIAINDDHFPFASKALNYISTDNREGLVNVAKNTRHSFVAEGAIKTINSLNTFVNSAITEDDNDELVIDDTDYSNYSRDENLDMDYEEWLKSKKDIENFEELEEELKKDIFQAENELWVELDSVNDDEISFYWLRSDEEEKRVGSEVFDRAAYEILHEYLHEMLPHKGERDIV